MPDLSHLALPLLAIIFAAAAAAVWVAGTFLSNSTDVLDTRLNLGEALGGLILLAITTNLPEIAITVTAALHHDIGVAIGNILGGIALQTVVLVALDVGVPGKRPLTWQAASLVLVLEGVLVTAVLVVTMMGTQLPKTLIVFRLTPEDVALVALWISGLWLLKRARTDLPWQSKGIAPGGEKTEKMEARRKKDDEKSKGQSTAQVSLVFGAAALVTLLAGFVLEQSSDGIAKHLQMTGVLFGATILAAATSLPELSTCDLRHLWRERVFACPVSACDCFVRSSRAAAGAENGYLPRRPRSSSHCGLYLWPDLSPWPTFAADGRGLFGCIGSIRDRSCRLVRNFGDTLKNSPALITKGRAIFRLT